ncbi:hypothetical protein [Paenibacillus sp. BJ-4]|uniref:hypothetical protein n=1 Tax=Paenibacillus sp. BJ-4 TaxID=2878097 RepID=UPI001CF0569E|nr:hypothetical protein [Paenibacillus sp. BJ-4]
MWEPIRFLLFSSVETFAAFVLMLTVFRIRALDYVWPALFIGLIMNLQSLVLREEISLSFFAPTINIILFTLLITTVVRMPIIWAAIISMTGTFLYTLFQAVIIVMLFGTLTTEMQSSAEGSLAQAVTSAWVLAVSWFLYKFKIGFKANYENLRFRWEHTLVVVLIIGLLAACTFMFYFNDFLLSILFIALASAMFLYYAFKTERDYYKKP